MDFRLIVILILYTMNFGLMFYPNTIHYGFCSYFHRNIMDYMILVLFLS